MAAIVRNISLRVPAELAFRYLGDPSHLTEYCKNIIEVSDVQRHPPASVKFTWAYKMMGIRIMGEAEIDETKHDQQLIVRFRGGIQGSVTWRLQPLDEGVELEVELDYMTPAPLLKKHSADDILHENEHAIEHMLTDLKARLEAHYARTFNHA